MADTIASTPNYEVLEGDLRDDGWTTRRLALKLPREGRDRVITLAIRNPTFNASYLRNTVAVSIDGEAVFADILFAGHSVQIEQRVAARDDMLLEIESEAFLVSDPLDQRERGVVLKLSQSAAPQA